MAAVVFLLGLVLVTAGAGLVYLPAGLIVCGVALLAGAWLYVRGKVEVEP